MPEIIVAGAGTGSVTSEVTSAIARAEAVCASERFLHLVPPGKKFIPLKKIDAAFAEIERVSGLVVILVSGDPGLFSLLPMVRRRFGEAVVLPGISSMQVLCARAGESWSDAVILSGHGRTLRPGLFLNTVERNRLVVLFCDGVNSPQWACGLLAGLDVRVVIGENLGTPEEKIMAGQPEAFAERAFPPLSLMLVKNPSPYVPVNFQPRDEEFLRAEGVVMTSEAVRSVILGRLNMRKDSVLWDIGAGTGSISVSAGLMFPESEIHAIECKPEAVRVIAENARKFHLHNIELHEGRALDIMGDLPEPSHVFIGGSDGELPGILAKVSCCSARVVAACVTLETLSTAFGIMKSWPEFEALQVSVSSSKTLSPSSTLMKAKAPVILLSAIISHKIF